MNCGDIPEISASKIGLILMVLAPPIFIGSCCMAIDPMMLMSSLYVLQTRRPKDTTPCSSHETVVPQFVSSLSWWVQISPISRLGWWMGVISIVFMGIINQHSHHYGGTTKKTTRYPPIGIQGAKSSGSRPAEFVSVKKTTWAIDEPTSDQHSATHNIPPPQKKGCRTSVNIP